MKKTFNMKKLSDAVSENFGLTRQSGSAITKYVFDRIKAELAAGVQVRLHQFGTLVAKRRKAGVARNPATGEKLKVPARRVLKLTVSPLFKKTL